MDFRIVQSLMKHESLPAVVVDLEAFDRNIQKAVKNAHPHPIRLATKSLRVPALIRRALKTSPHFQGLMCYSVKEMKFLADQGFDDFLLAYPTVQISDLKIFSELTKRGTKFCCVVDSLEHLEIYHRFFQSEKLDSPLRLILEVDASLHFLSGRLHLGVRRSPIRRISDAVKLVSEFQHRNYDQNLSFVGLMMYEAQVAGLTDRNPFTKLRNPIAHLIRIFSARRLKQFRTELRREIERALKKPLEIFNGGGTGSLAHTQYEGSLSEVTMGSGLLCSHLFDYYSDAHYEPSCYFLTQIVRRSDSNWVTALGGGYIASGSPGWDRWPRPWWPNGLSLTDMEGAGEVQTPLKISGPDIPNLGDTVFFRHAKAGELAERFDEYLLIEKNQIVEKAKTYRGSSLTTL